MATSTPRLALQKPNPDPVTGDFIDVSVLNGNSDKLDAAMGATPCTSATRPASPFDGQLIRETDTRRVYVRNNAQGVWEQVAIGGFVTAVKTGNEILPMSTTALQDDDHLFLQLEANSTYVMDGDIIYYSAVGADLQAGWSAPAGASFEWSSFAPSATHTGTPAYEGPLKFESRNVGNVQTWGGTGVIVHAAPRGCIQTVSAGTLRFRWAQQTAVADNNIVYAKSWIRLQKVA